MRIALICKRHYTNKDLISEKFGRLYHFPYHWVKGGHDVYVNATHYSALSVHNYVYDGIMVDSVPIWNPLRWYQRLVRDPIEAFRPDIVVASGDSHFGMLGHRIARQLGVAFAFDVYDDYSKFGTNRLPFIGKMFEKTIRAADLVVCASEPLSERIAHLSRSIVVAEQGSDFDLFKPIDQNLCRARYKLPTTVTLLGFCGSIDSRFDLPLLLQSLETLNEKHGPTKLVVCGPNVERLDLSDQHIIYLGPKPQKEVPFIIGACDLMLMPYRKTALSETCNPCKLSEYIGCEKPIVSSNVSNVADYMRGSEKGLYEPGTVESFLTAVGEQLSDPQLVEKTNALEWSVIADRYSIFLSTAIESRANAQRANGARS
ncbi:MAG: glycosyltransferase [Proteobacteria bacterium]|nr:glycosyltransferase [Pseudomonadota bacterium]